VLWEWEATRRRPSVEAERGCGRMGNGESLEDLYRWVLPCEGLFWTWLVCMWAY
jgi:hypothetical protein